MSCKLFTIRKSDLLKLLVAINLPFLVVSGATASIITGLIS